MPTDGHCYTKTPVVTACIGRLNNGATVFLRNNRGCVITTINAGKCRRVCDDACAKFIDHLLANRGNGVHEECSDPYDHCEEWRDAAVFGLGH